MMGVLLTGVCAPAAAQDDKEAIAAITKVIKSKPANLEDQVKDVFKKNKKNPEVLIGIGRAYYEVKDTANARNFAEHALKANKKFGPAYMLLGDIAALGNDGGKAVQEYTQAIYFDPKNPEPYYKYATVYRKISPNEAVAKLEELRQYRPDLAVDARIAYIYYLSGKIDKAIECYAKCDKGSMSETELTDYATALWMSRKYQEGLDVVKFGLQKSPRRAAYNRLALFTSTDMGAFDEALKYANDLFQNSDTTKYTYYDYTYYGNALSGAKQYDKAIEMYNEALKQQFDDNSKRAGVIKQLTDAYKMKDDYENAIKTYNEYLAAIGTAGPNDYAGLAQLYTQQAAALPAETPAETRNELFKKAEQVYVDLETKYPDALEYATFMRARVNSYIDPETKEGLAKPFYEKLAGLIEPKATKDNADKARLVECYRYLGYFSLMQNDKATADTFWKKILEIDPENDIAKKALGIAE